MDYEKKYNDLVSFIENELVKVKEIMRDTKEPKWPDSINNRKEVIWFRNDVFDSAFERGRRGELSQIMDFIKNQTK